MHSASDPRRISMHTDPKRGRREQPASHPTITTASGRRLACYPASAFAFIDQVKLLRQCCHNLEPSEILPTIHGSLFFDPHAPPWNDVRVRQAVLKAIDREALIVSLQGGVAHSSFVPAAFTGIAWPEEKLKYDLEGAKRLLAESGYNFTARTLT